MYRIKMNFLKSTSFLIKRLNCQAFRCYSEHRVVYLSQSNDIFTNLALEDWLYRHFDFSKQTLLLLWQNSPCVVIGRHQNPLAEVSLDAMSSAHVRLARRNSGGGTVYHDFGNLNCTFFTSREKYNRKKNLEIICSALNDTWNLNSSVSSREDIVVNDTLKISGTASKLGGKNAYHHCTVLVDADVEKLRRVLKPPEFGMESKATASVRSKVANLKELNPDVDVKAVMEIVGDYFLNGVPRDYRKGFTLINPTDSWFAGLDKLVNDFSSWDWIHGKTPRFSVKRNVPEYRAVVEIQCYHGTVEKLTFAPLGPEANPVNLDGRTGFWNSLLMGKKIKKELYSELLANDLHFNCSATKYILEILKIVCR